MLSRKVATQLKEIETPFYLYDINLLRQTLESVVYESNKYNYKVHYAIKANNDDYLLSIIKEYGIGIDCASGNEVRKAIESGFDPKTVVYAGVGKRDKEIRYALEQEILAINCESIEELQVVNELAAQMGKKTYVNGGWQFNGTVGNSFVETASGYGAYIEGGYYITPMFAVGGFASFNTNNAYIPKQTYTFKDQSALTTDVDRSIYQVPFGLTMRTRFMRGELQPYLGTKIGAEFST